MHHTFVDVVRNMAKSGWGRNHQAFEDAAKSLSPNGITVADAALLEMVRRFEQLIEAWTQEEVRKRLSEICAKDGADERPANAKLFPGIKIRDFLYYCYDLEEGIHSSVVIDVKEDGAAIVVKLCDRPEARYACDFDFRTPEEALEEQAKNDIEYYANRLAMAKAALKAAKSGKCDEFMDGANPNDFAKK